MLLTRIEHYRVPLWQVSGHRLGDTASYVSKEQGFSCECRILHFDQHTREALLLPIAPKRPLPC